MDDGGIYIINMPNDGVWRRVLQANGLNIERQCGNENNVRIVDGDVVIWRGSQRQAQVLGMALVSAASATVVS